MNTEGGSPFSERAFHPYGSARPDLAQSSPASNQRMGERMWTQSESTVPVYVTLCHSVSLCVTLGPVDIE